MEAFVINMNQPATPANATTQTEQKADEQLTTTPVESSSAPLPALREGWTITPSGDVPVDISAPRFWAIPASSSSPIDSTPGIGSGAAPLGLGSTPMPLAVASLMPMMMTTTSSLQQQPPFSVTGPAATLPLLPWAVAQAPPQPGTSSSSSSYAVHQHALQQNCWVQQMLLTALFQQQQVMLGSSTAPWDTTTGASSPSLICVPEEEEPPYFDPEFKPKRPLSAYNFFL